MLEMMRITRMSYETSYTSVSSGWAQHCTRSTVLSIYSIVELCTVTVRFGLAWPGLLPRENGSPLAAVLDSVTATESCTVQVFCWPLSDCVVAAADNVGD